MVRANGGGAARTACRAPGVFKMKSLPAALLVVVLSLPAWAGSSPSDAASLPDLKVQVADPAAWRALLNSVGLEPTAGPARFRILIGDDAAAADLGFRPADRRVQVASVAEEREPSLRIVWEHPREAPVYEVPGEATVFTREKRTGAPLLAGLLRGSGGVLWAAAEPGIEGYERYPYLLHALVDLGLRLPFRDDRRHVFFDSSYRQRVDFDYMARRWREGGVQALHVAAWHFTGARPGAEDDLDQLISACHREGILAYAWLELPHVSEAFWAGHPECREQTATLQDARLDWRKLINLADPSCFARAAENIQDLLSRHDWDGVNLAELYFESLHGPSNPARFTPMNTWVRDDYRQRRGVDPLQLFAEDSPLFWSRNREAWMDFAAYRSGLTLRLQQEWLELLRTHHSGLDLMVTQIDDRLDPRMKEYLGADAASLLPLAEPYGFRLVIEDPATLWDRGPGRYTDIAARYRPLVSDPDRLAVDINIVERYQQTYPTRKQVGGELFRLLHAAGEAFSQVLLYFEHSISRSDWGLLPNAVAGITARETEDGVLVDTARSAGLSWSSPAKVNGRLWPVLDGATVWLPAGRHLVSAAGENPPMTLLRLTADLIDASVDPSGLRLSYRSPSRAIALVNLKPEGVTVNGEALEAPILKGRNHWAVLLPQGRNDVLIHAGGLVR